MSIQIVGISGSPIPDSNTDRAVKRILELTGLTQPVRQTERLGLGSVPGVPGMREDEPVRCSG